jgi:hypothetical protein
MLAVLTTVLTTILTTTATTATTATPVLPAHAAAPTVELQPERLPRGADIGVPHIDDGDFVDGDRRVELPGQAAEVIGRSGDAWLVGTYDVDPMRNRRVVRVEADGTLRPVLRGLDPWEVVLTADGSRLVAVPRPRLRGSVVNVWAADDGSLLAQREFSGYLGVVDADERRVLLHINRRLLWWRVASDRVRTLTRKYPNAASIEHDLISLYTKDPYRGGCTKLVRLSDLHDTLWESCRDRIADISPDGAQMFTMRILTDGLGADEIRLREIDGTRLATYTTGWFSDWAWESPTTVLLKVNGTKKAATVRCTLDACENATDPVKVQMP